MATETANKKTQSKNSGKKTSTTPKTQPVVSDETPSLPESSSTTEEVSTPELPPLTEEDIAAQKDLLERGIARGMEWFEFGRDEEQYNSMTEKEQAFTRLLDPMMWLMREALISYTEREEGCEECTLRVENRGNGLQLAVADLLLGVDDA